MWIQIVAALYERRPNWRNEQICAFGSDRPAATAAILCCALRRRCLRARCQFFVFLDPASHSVGRLGAFGDPVLNAIKLDGAVMPGLLGVVRPDNFQKSSIPRTAFVRHDNFKIRAIQRAFSS